MSSEVLAPAGDQVRVPAAGGGSRARAGSHPGLRAHGREIAGVICGSLMVAAVMTWPVLRNPTRTVPQDLVDPLYFVWQIAWTGHALRTDPAGMWSTNAFGHVGGNLAYTDTVLGYAPFAAVADATGGGVGAALLSYNLLYVLATALAFASAYLLARVLGARAPGALVLAAAFAFAPWRLAHARHLNVLSTGGIVLALALLAYGHGWMLRRRARRAAAPDQPPAEPPARRPVRPGWIMAGWGVACWQLSLGFAVGVPFAWVLGAVMLAAVVLGWRQRPWDPAMVHADRWGAALFILTGLALTVPYQLVVRRFPVAQRTEEMVALYSPHPLGLITAPAENLWWGSIQAGWRTAMAAPAEQALLPGFVLIVLAVIGLRWSAWSVRARVGLALSAVLFAVLALGVSTPGDGRFTYLAAFRYLPGWEALRTPGRLVLWCGLALGLLAAGAVTAAADRIDRRSRPRGRASGWLRVAVLLVPAALVLSEGAGTLAVPTVPSPPMALKSLPDPVLVMPTSMQGDYQVMTWSTDGWPDLINGGSGFEPPKQSRLRRTAAQFPTQQSAAGLRRMGVRTIVLIKDQASGTAWQWLASQPVALTRAQALGVGATMRDTGPALVFDLAPGT